MDAEQKAAIGFRHVLYVVRPPRSFKCCACVLLQSATAARGNPHQWATRTIRCIVSVPPGYTVEESDVHLVVPSPYQCGSSISACRRVCCFLNCTDKQSRITESIYCTL